MRDIDMTFGPARQMFETMSRDNALMDFALRAPAALANTGAWSTFKGVTSISWTHAMNLLKANPLWGKKDNYDAELASRISPDMF